MLGLTLLLLLGLALFVALSTWAMVHRLRHPPRRTAAWAVSRSLPADPGEMSPPRAFESASVRARANGRDYDLPVWRIAGDEPTGPVIVMSPGWGDSRVGGLVRLPALAQVAREVIAWDSPGQGECAGLCPMGVDEPDLLIALLREIARWNQGPPARTVLYGWSLGGGASIAAAARARGDEAVRIVGVIAEAPYRVPWTPAYRVMHLTGMPYRINGPLAFAALGFRLGVGTNWRGFDRAEYAAAMRCPLAVIHGDQDEVCPLEDGRSIVRAASDAGGRAVLIEVPGASHNNLWTDDKFREQCAGAVWGFVRSLEIPSA